MANKPIMIRMPDWIIELIDKVAEARGEDRSSLIRRGTYRELAALSYLSDEQKKALGIREVA